jgi:hypothetical protein
MSKADLSSPQPSSLLAALKGDRDPTATAAAAIQKAAFLERVRRSAQRDLALLEMADVEALGSRGIAATGNLASQAVAEVEVHPSAVSGVGRILGTADVGLDRALHRYLDEA